MNEQGYAAACKRATTDQGLDPIVERLTAEGFGPDVDQTGGFTMCVRVDRPDDGWYAYVTSGEYTYGEDAGSWAIFAYADDYDHAAGSEGVELTPNGAADPDDGVAIVRRFVAGEIPETCQWCNGEGCKSCAFVGYVAENVDPPSLAAQTTITPTTIGIPYATALVVDGVLVRVCPRCGVQIEEDADADGESQTNRYADHFVTEHAARTVLVHLNLSVLAETADDAERLAREQIPETLRDRIALVEAID